LIGLNVRTRGQLAPSEIATSVWKLELQRGKWQKAALYFQYKNYCKGSN